MRYSCKTSVEYDLKLHYDLLDKYETILKSLSEFSGCKIKIVKSDGESNYYSIKGPAMSDYKYIGTSDNTDIISAREYAYYEKAISLIRKNIKVMEQFMTIYRSTRAESINELLPRVYQLPPSDMYLVRDPEIERWLSGCQAAKNNYPIFDEAGLKVIAFDGTPMRSRAEALHYEAFFIYNIPAIFELPFKIGKDVLHPDFTTLYVFTMAPVIWEHLGNWFHENEYKRKEYRKDSIDRWDEYTRLKFYPEVNLMLSFGSNDNILDIQALHRKIASFAAPPPSPETIHMLRHC